MINITNTKEKYHIKSIKISIIKELEKTRKLCWIECAKDTVREQNKSKSKGIDLDKTK